MRIQPSLYNTSLDKNQTLVKVKEHTPKKKEGLKKERTTRTP
jgi:hypothetical protein